MDIREERKNGVLVLALVGRLDATTSKLFEDKILATIDGGQKQFVIDLSQLDYISSSGLRVFLLASKRLNPVGGKVVLCSLKEPVRQVFEIAGFVSILPIVTSREEAFKKLQSS